MTECLNDQWPDESFRHITADVAFKLSAEMHTWGNAQLLWSHLHPSGLTAERKDTKKCLDSVQEVIHRALTQDRSGGWIKCELGGVASVVFCTPNEVSGDVNAMFELFWGEMVSVSSTKGVLTKAETFAQEKGYTSVWLSQDKGIGRSWFRVPGVLVSRGYHPSYSCPGQAGKSFWHKSLPETVSDSTDGEVVQGDDDEEEPLMNEPGQDRRDEENETVEEESVSRQD